MTGHFLLSLFFSFFDSFQGSVIFSTSASEAALIYLFAWLVGDYGWDH